MHQRIRIRYTKEGRVRFVSARDLTSVWERALRRADLPIAYSEGFTPHAKVSFPDALPVGYASTGEYAELTFAAPIDPARDLGRLSDTLPEGMDITTFLEVPDGAPKLARMLPATLWELVWPAIPRPEARPFAADLAAASEQLLAADHAEVVRHRPDGDRTLDVRPAVVALRVPTPTDAADGDVTTPAFRAVLRNDGPTIRPTDLLTALGVWLDVQPPEPWRIRRLAQGEAVDEGLREALSGEVVPLVSDVDAEAA